MKMAVFMCCLLLVTVACAEQGFMIVQTQSCNVHHYIDYTADFGKASVFLNDSINASYVEDLSC